MYYLYPSEGRQNENHNHRKLIKLITWTTALSNSMKQGLPKTDGLWWRVLTKCGPLEKGMVNQYCCLENPMSNVKREKDMTLKDELLRFLGAQNAIGEEWRNNSRKNEDMEPKQKQLPVWDVTGDGSKVLMM